MAGGGFPGGSDGKKICLQCQRPEFYPWVGKIHWRREWLPTPLFLPGEFHGQKSLAAYSPWGHRVGHDWVTNTFTSLTKSPQVLNLDLCEFKKKYIPVICDQFSVLGLPGILVLFLHLRKSFKKTNKEIFHLMTLPPNKATCFCRYFLFQPSFLLENGHIIYDQPKLWMQSQFYKKAGILNPFCYRRGIN